MYYTYILENEEGRRYIGSCEDIAERLRTHNGNSVRSTKNKGPYRLIYKEEFATKKEARKRENQLKNYKGNNTFKRLLKTSVPIV